MQHLINFPDLQTNWCIAILHHLATKAARCILLVIIISPDIIVNNIISFWWNPCIKILSIQRFRQSSCWLDLDGVLVDFDLGVRQLLDGWPWWHQSKFDVGMNHAGWFLHKPSKVLWKQLKTLMVLLDIVTRVPYHKRSRKRKFLGVKEKWGCRWIIVIWRGQRLLVRLFWEAEERDMSCYNLLVQK